MNDAGVEGPADHWVVDRIGETRLHRILSNPGFIDARMQGLTLTPGPLSGPVVSCERLVYAFPNLTQRTVHGVMGRLEDAGALNKLRSLISLDLYEVFGMSAEDCLNPSRMTKLEHIELRNVPGSYADAMRRAWKPHTKRGVYVSISGARKPEWVAQNMANPLRGWDGREGISLTRLRQGPGRVEPVHVPNPDRAHRRHRGGRASGAAGPTRCAVRRGIRRGEPAVRLHRD